MNGVILQLVSEMEYCTRPYFAVHNPLEKEESTQLKEKEVKKYLPILLPYNKPASTTQARVLQY